VNPEHLYIHVPFCVRRCGYCDFAVTATSRAPVDAWLAAVRAELELRARRGSWALPLQLQTLYVGGGTPSLLGVGAMAALREVLAPFAGLERGAEWTAEANPESFTVDLARDWAAAGVNRISLGAQTFHEPALRWMGRLHGAAGPGTAVAAAREAGFHNVSIDLIFALPAALGRDWGRDLELAMALQPAHVSLYGLTAEAATPLGRRVAEGREQLPDEDRYAAEYLLAVEQLTSAGFQHYEVSNFARPGLKSRHNAAYWEHRPYVGIGPGAHSYAPPVRSWNVRDWAEYRDRLARGKSPEDAQEELGPAELALERIWLGLRSDAGVPVADLAPSQRRVVQGWQQAGWAAETAGSVRLSAAGWLLLDRLAVDLAALSG
jgi:oxygen-independent coproporphyrinogen III oxidase